ERGAAAGAVPVPAAAGVRAQGVRGRVLPRRGRAVLPGRGPGEGRLREGAGGGGGPAHQARRGGGEVVLRAGDDGAKRWKKGQLIGFEVTPDKDEDPCEVYLSEYREAGGGRELPQKIDVRRGDKRFASLNVTKVDLK